MGTELVVSAGHDPGASVSPLNLSGARPTNRLGQKMCQSPWRQELDEAGYFGRFAVKMRLGFFSLLGLLDERASSARFSHAAAR
jgi:hypothetical protein